MTRGLAISVSSATIAAIRVVNVLAAAVVVAAGLSCAGGEARTEPARGFVAELTRLGVPRTIAPRLSIPVDPSAGRDALPTRDHLELMRRIAGLNDAAPDADALHASALMSLVWSTAGRNTLDTSISYLRAAAELSANPARILSDLAAAELVRADRDHDPLDLFAAVEAADSALVLDPHLAPAAFNVALAIDRLRLPSEATRAWKRYLEIDSVSGWAKEASEHLSRVAVTPHRDWPSLASQAESLRAFARRNPQTARVIGMDRWLGQWGEAVLAGDDFRAAAILTATQLLGEGLTDRSIADEVAELHGATGTRRLALASAHVSYSAGQAASAATNQVQAAKHFAGVLASKTIPPAPLALWAAVGRGAALVYGGDASERDRRLANVLANADAARYPAVVSRAHWAEGTIRLRSGLYESAIEHYALARSGFAVARETENVGAMEYLTGETLLSLGDRAAGYESITASLHTLAPVGPSVWLHNALSVTSRNLEGDGMPRAALRLSNENVRVTDGLGESLGLQTAPPVYLAEALVDRARLISRFRPDSVSASLARADTLLSRVSDAFPRQWVGAQLRYVHATMIANVEPAKASAELSDVIAAFNGRNAGKARNAARHLAALIARASAHTSLRDTARALADLDSAVVLIDAERVAISREGNREALAGATRAVLDTLVSLELATGDTAGALTMSERGRLAISPIARLPRRAPPGRRVVVYRLLGNRLLAWTIGESGVELNVKAVDDRRLRATCARVRALLDRQATAEVVRTDLSNLYNDLVAPVADRLGVVGAQVTIVPDGFLAGVPFPALYNSASSRYLVQDHEVRVELSVRDALMRVVRDTRSRGRALLIANPAFDTVEHASFVRLYSADAEVAALDSIYGGRARVLMATGADTSSVKLALKDASVVHYAGHAVSDERRPEQSFLLLAPTPGSKRSDRLTAEAIRGLRLKNIKLVVLAACETLGASTEQSTGFRGLATAFRAAGAHGVIGSLWRIDDASTKALMVNFHRAYVASGNAAAALREAQLRLLATKDPRLRSPAAWAAFQYNGN